MSNLWKYLYQKDTRAFFYLNQKMRCRILDIIMPRITHLGGAIFTMLLCFVLYTFGQKDAKIAAAEAFVTVSGSQGIVQLFKRRIYRKRPYMVLPEVNTFWSKLLKDYSFPSGHTTAGFSMAAILSIYFPSYSLLTYSLACAVGISRVYTGMHYPSDVLSGAFLGTGFAIFTHTVRCML